MDNLNFDGNDNFWKNPDKWPCKTQLKCNQVAFVCLADIFYLSVEENDA